MAGHLFEPDRGCLDHIPRSFIFTVSPAEVARVMKSDGLVLENIAVQAQGTLMDQFLKKLAVVPYLIMTSKIGIFILKSIVGVWICGQDLFNTISIEDLHVGHGLHLKQYLIASPAGHIAAGGLLGTQYGIADVQMGQHLDQGPGYF